MTDAYLEILKKKDKIDSISDVERFVKKSLHTEISLSNSQLNRREKIRSEFLGLDAIEKALGIEDWADYEMKAEENRKETEKAVIVEMYRKKENNAINLTAFELYLSGLSTCRDMGAVLGVSKDSAARLINEMKEDLNKFSLSLGCVIN